MKNKKGFTLIELIVVLAILAVIAAIAVPTAFGSIEKARNAADTASVEALNSSIRMQAALLQALPSAEAATENTVAKAFDAANITAQKFQSKTVVLTFIPATANTVASFSVAFSGTTNITTTSDIVTNAKAITVGSTTAGDSVCTILN